MQILKTKTTETPRSTIFFIDPAHKNHFYIDKTLIYIFYNEHEIKRAKSYMITHASLSLYINV